MADFTIDTKPLDRFNRDLEDLQRFFPKQARQFMLRSGTKAKVIISQKALQLVRKRTGNYHKSIKRGKVWVDGSTSEYKVRVYSGAPHAHLIEYGHRIVDAGGKEHGFQEGYHVFEKAANEIESQWTDILESEFDKIMSKL
jgi:hypothetical protein